MTLIENWLQGNLAQFTPFRVVATPEARCNLQCEHCFWSHELTDKSIENWGPAVSEIRKLNIPLVYAGRMLTKAGIAFVKECLAQGVEVGSIVDNGYTILNAPDLLPSFGQITISIDGWREAHDQQRAKVGSFDKAWETVLELKRQGFDPIVNAVLSPLTMPNWGRFEDLLAEHDVRMASTLVWSFLATSTRGTAIFPDASATLEAFEKLLGGIPKLVALYSPEHIETLKPVLDKLSWKKDENTGDGFVSILDNGTKILYQPASIAMTGEVTVNWDGVLSTTSIYSPKVPISGIDKSFFDLVKRINLRERAAFNPKLKGGE